MVLTSLWGFKGDISLHSAHHLDVLAVHRAVNVLQVVQSSWQSYLIPELLGEVGGLVQRETGHKRRGEDVRAAQLGNHIGHIEERVILQQLSDTQTVNKTPEPNRRKV